MFDRKVEKNITSVLFVCLGNICRSPSAEAIFRHKAANAGLAIKIDSAGTLGAHIGSPPDKRSRTVGEGRGYHFKKIKCRKVNSSDFEQFDYVIAMDKENVRNCEADEEEVPDPYYGGKRGFEYVLDLIEQASDGLIEHIKQQHT